MPWLRLLVASLSPRRPGLTTGHLMWDFWWRKWKSEKFCTSTSVFPLSVSLQEYSTLINSSIADYIRITLATDVVVKQNTQIKAEQSQTTRCRTRSSPPHCSVFCFLPSLWQLSAINSDVIALNTVAGTFMFMNN